MTFSINETSQPASTDERKTWVRPTIVSLDGGETEGKPSSTFTELSTSFGPS